MITVDADIGSSINRAHYALVPSHKFSFAPALHDSSELLRRDWEHLELDPYMADGGRYRSVGNNPTWTDSDGSLSGQWRTFS